MLVTLDRAQPVLPPEPSLAGRTVAAQAIADYQSAFEQLDAYAAELRADGWDEGAEIIQGRAEIAYRAARAERFQEAMDR
jgi:hypothetical protein